MLSTPKQSKQKRVYTPEQKARISARQKAQYVANRDEILAKRREYRETNPDKRKNLSLKSLYGITLDERNAILAAQGGVCAICETDSPGKRDWNTDHCHSTGRVRGILCSHCNVMLGYARDNTAVLSKAIKYLN